MMAATLRTSEPETCEALIAWLSRHGPDAWHAWAENMNAGSDFLPVLDWILAQPSCNKATAIFAFWRSGVDDFVSWRPNPDEPDEPDEPATREKLLQRMQCDCYNYELAFNVLEYWHRGTYPDDVRPSKWALSEIATFKAIYERNAAKLPDGVNPFSIPAHFETRGTRIEPCFNYFEEARPLDLHPKQRWSNRFRARYGRELTYDAFKALASADQDKFFVGAP